MKITVAYLPSEEERVASGPLVALLRELPDAKVKKSTAHPPYRHIYLSTKQPKET